MTTPRSTGFQPVRNKMQTVRKGRKPAPRGFTLVELLVVIVILSMLMTLALGALYQSQEAARAAKTRSLISKLDALIQDKYESYRTRRLPITMNAGAAPSAVASTRLLAVRALLRMEMPDRWYDILDNPPTAANLGAAAATGLPNTAVFAAYRRRYNGNKDPVSGALTPPSAKEQDAECLYLIVSMLREEESLDLLLKNSADTDEDGMPEFIDAWGKPIRWLRWPTGFVGPAADSALQVADPQTFPDPFDPLKRDQILYTRTPSPFAFKTVPLIYSAGPDKVYDILGEFVDGAGNPNLHYQLSSNDPYIKDLTNKFIGQPEDFGSDGLEHMDNIHNHVLEIR